LCQRRFLNVLLPVLGEPPGAAAAGSSPQQLAGTALPDAGLPGGNAPGITLLNIGTGLLKAPGGAGGPRSTGVTTCVSGQAGAGCGQSAPSSSMSVITGGGGAGTAGGGLLPLGFPGGGTHVKETQRGVRGRWRRSVVRQFEWMPAPTFSSAAYPASDPTHAGLISTIIFFSGDPLYGTCGQNPLTMVTGTIRPASPP
jgi:hypothetical protein